MAMSVPKVGFQRFMKEGTKHFRGIDEAVMRNIEAAGQLAATVRSSYGPYGMNKMVINHLEKLFVTNDAATIVKELEVEHPAAKMLVLASQQQETELGDGTNAVIIFAAALLEHAGELLNMGLKPVEIADGYDQAHQKAVEILESLVCEKVSDLRNVDQLKRAIKPVIMSKQLAHHQALTDLIARACIQIMPANDFNLNVDNVRGSSVSASQLMNGMVFRRGAEGDIKKMDNAKIAVFTCPFDLTATETKGTVLLNTADELLNYSKGEEAEVERQVTEIHKAGVTCIVSGGKIGDLYMHYINRLGIMAVRLQSKFDLRRLCRTTGATANTKICVPTPDSLGSCSAVYTTEIGDSEVVCFRQDSQSGKVATVIIRGSSDNLMDDVERAIDDGVNTVKALTKDARLVAGAGATEIELARQIESFGEKCAGLEQYSIKKYALALEALPKQLADNAGMKSTELLSKLYAAHTAGNKFAGVDVTSSIGATTTDSSTSILEDAQASGVVDLYALKFWMLRLATNAAITVLSIDQIIMAKPAGAGPKPGGPGGPGGPHGMDVDDD